MRVSTTLGHREDVQEYRQAKDADTDDIESRDSTAGKGNLERPAQAVLCRLGCLYGGFGGNRHAGPPGTCGQQSTAHKAEHGLPSPSTLMTLKGGDDESSAHRDDGCEVCVLYDEKRTHACGDLVGEHHLIPGARRGRAHASEEGGHHAKPEQAAEKWNGHHDERGDVLVVEEPHGTKPL